MPPVNDDFANATDVGSAASGSVAGSNVDATVEADEPDAGSYGDVTVWWKWTCPAGRVSATFRTLGSTNTTGDPGADLDTVLFAYDPSAGPLITDLSLIDYNDDAGRHIVTSELTFAVTPGQVYYLKVDGYGSDQQGDIVLAWETVKAPPTFAAPSIWGSLEAGGVEWWSADGVDIGAAVEHPPDDDAFSSFDLISQGGDGSHANGKVWIPGGSDGQFNYMLVLDSTGQWRIDKFSLDMTVLLDRWPVAEWIDHTPPADLVSQDADRKMLAAGRTRVALIGYRFTPFGPFYNLFYTGDVQSVVVPDGYTVMQFVITAGGRFDGEADTASVTGTRSVTPGQTIYALVGQVDDNGSSSGGWPDALGKNTAGSTSLRLNGTTLADRIAVAGAPGGGLFNGGHGGNPDGGSVDLAAGSGHGATQSAPGAGGHHPTLSYADGAPGVGDQGGLGGSDGNGTGGAGGPGYFGGGGGASDGEGGGGGSSWADGECTHVTYALVPTLGFAANGGAQLQFLGGPPNNAVEVVVFDTAGTELALYSFSAVTEDIELLTQTGSYINDDCTKVYFAQGHLSDGRIEIITVDLDTGTRTTLFVIGDVDAAIVAADPSFAGFLGTPAGIVVLPDGDLILTGVNGLFRVQPDGTPVWWRPGPAISESWSGLAPSGRSSVWACRTDSTRADEYSLDGTSVQTISLPGQSWHAWLAGQGPRWLFNRMGFGG